eukprot:1548585-Amphidinium_carterae.1
MKSPPQQSLGLTLLFVCWVQSAAWRLRRGGQSTKVAQRHEALLFTREAASHRHSFQGSSLHNSIQFPQPTNDAAYLVVCFSSRFCKNALQVCISFVARDAFRSSTSAIEMKRVHKTAYWGSMTLGTPPQSFKAVRIVTK